MNELISMQAAGLFTDLNKWNAFLELHSLKDKIIDQWYTTLKDRLEKRLTIDSEVWKFRKWQPKSWGWHTGSDPGSLVILYENNNYCLWIEGSRYDTNRIIDTFRNQKIFSGFFRPTEIQPNNSFLAIRRNAISVQGLSNPDILAWHAGQDKDESKTMHEDVFRFFSFFMTDPEILRMILEINQMTK